MAKDVDKYALRRAVLPGLLAASSSREKAWVVVAGCALTFAAATSWHSTNLVADAKLEGSKCEPRMLDGHGNIIPTTPLSAADVTRVDGMVAEKIGDAVKCLRGLDTAAKAITACWSKYPAMFATTEARNKLEDYRRTNYTTKQVLQRMEHESVEVVIRSWGKPDPVNTPGRYWLRWEEVHRNKAGIRTATPEVWSGEFDIEIVVQGQNADSWNPVEIHAWQWRKDVVGGS